MAASVNRGPVLVGAYHDTVGLGLVYEVVLGVAYGCLEKLGILAVDLLVIRAPLDFCKLPCPGSQRRRNIRILHSGLSPRFQKPWFVGSLCSCFVVWAHWYLDLTGTQNHGVFHSCFFCIQAIASGSSKVQLERRFRWVDG